MPRVPTAPAALLAFTVTALLPMIAVSSANAEPIADGVFERWGTYRHTRMLGDGSSMSEYAGETESVSTDGFLLRIGFIPQFACQPLITVVANRDPQGEPLTIDAVRPVDFQIDGRSLELPVLAEQDVTGVRLYYDAPVARIAALREQIDRSDMAFIRTAGDEVVVFSLFGSTRTLDIAERLCGQHPPVAADADDP